MDVKNIDVVQSLSEMTWTFCLSTELWEKYLVEKHDVDLSKLIKIPYFEDDSTKLSKEVSSIPNDKGGIYLYVLENPVVPGAGRHIMYVGRARKTEKENLRARAKSHFAQYKRADENSRLVRLYEKWAPYVYFMYIPLDSNEVIDQAEEELIVSLTPPCNIKYPSVKIRNKLSAFQYS